MTISFGRVAAVSLLLALGLAACTAGGPAGSPGSSSPGGSPVASGPPAASAPTPVPVPSGPGTVDGGSGGGSAPNPGSGGLVPVTPGGDPPMVRPEPTIVQPATGLLNVHPVGAVELVPTVDGRHVTVRVAWWSGVEPCNVLAGVDVARDGRTFTLTVREGAARLDVACIEIAMYKATVVDLGELDPGEYTIAAFGEVAPVTVTVAG